jgi:hypothetical protein
MYGADPEVRRYLDQVVSTLRDHLGDGLVGAYLQRMAPTSGGRQRDHEGGPPRLGLKISIFSLRRYGLAGHRAKVADLPA